MLNRTTNAEASASMGKRIARGGVWVLLNRILVAVTQVVALAILARLLTPEEMGIYFLISNFVIVGSVLVQFGIPQVLVKQTAESIETGTSEQTRSVIVSGLLVGFLAAVVFFVIFYWLLGDWIALQMFNSPLMAQLMLFVVLWLVIQSIQRIVGESFRGLHDLKLAAIFGGMFSGVVSTVILLVMMVAYQGCTLEQAVIVFLISMALSFVAALFCLHKKVGLFSTHSGLQFKSLMVLAFPVLFATLGNIVLSRADIWLLGMFADEHQLALYGAAARLVGLLSTPLLMASAVLAPMIVQLNKQKDMERLQRVVQLVPTLVAVPALFIIGLFLIFGDWVLTLIYGDVFYQDAWNVLNILAVGQVLALLAGVSIQILLMTAGQKIVMAVTLACTALAILLSVLYVDQYGIEGVAAAFALGIGLQSLICMAFCRITLGINTNFSVVALLNAKSTLQMLRESRRKVTPQA